MSQISLSFMPPIEQIPHVRHLYNTGTLADIPTGIYLTGKYGESILNGGVGMMTGVVGIGNSYKSTITHTLALSAASMFKGTRYSIYDTELNAQPHRLSQIARGIRTWDGIDVANDGVVEITDKTLLLGNEWYEKKKEQYKAKVKAGKSIVVSLPFLEKDGSQITVPFPTFDAIDSFTEFETADVDEMQRDNELGDSGANTIFMRQGQSKTRFLQDVIKHLAVSNSSLLLTAHVGKVIGMDPRSPPPKNLQHLKNGDVIKGVTSKFLFLTTVCWQTVNCTVLYNDGTKGPEYPRQGTPDLKGDADMNIVTLSLLRNKNGPSGQLIQFIVSQQDGMLSDLSRFHYIKGMDRFGMEGNVQNYTLSLMPDVALSRTKVRSKLETDPKLCRALGITADMCQIFQYYDYLDPKLRCTPKQLYDELRVLGYDWEVLLNTRSSWTYDNDRHEIPFLSTMDLLKMRIGLYHPYWLASDKRSVLKPSEYRVFEPVK
jgi:hypothetical protein